MARAIDRRPHRHGVLIAAHGDRGNGDNERIHRLARAIAARLGGIPVEAGFIKGEPSIAAAIDALGANHVTVYPFFLADGYFGQTVLPRLVDEACESRGCSATMLPPLGVDPALCALIVRAAQDSAHSHGFNLQSTTLILLAHGSLRDANSATAAEKLAEAGRRHRIFRDVRTAFLDQPPSLAETVSGIAGPVAVVGLFASDGLHGVGDARRLMAQLGRNDAIYAGNAGLLSGLDELVAAVIATQIPAWQRPELAQGASVVGRELM